MFAPFRLDPGARRLTANDLALTLGGRAYDTLLALVERRDRTVSKHELLDIVWPRLVVEKNNLQVQVIALRKLLGHHAIATVPGRGYRFTLPVAIRRRCVVAGGAGDAGCRRDDRSAVVAACDLQPVATKR